jgi:hypothetical protein
LIDSCFLTDHTLYSGYWYARGPRLGPDNSDDYVSDDVLMVKSVRGELVGIKNVSSVDSAAVSGYGAAGAGARDRRRPDTDNITTDRTIPRIRICAVAVRRLTVPLLRLRNSNPDGKFLSAVIKVIYTWIRRCRKLYTSIHRTRRQGQNASHIIERANRGNFQPRRKIYIYIYFNVTSDCMI